MTCHIWQVYGQPTGYAVCLTCGKKEPITGVMREIQENGTVGLDMDQVLEMANGEGC